MIGDRKEHYAMFEDFMTGESFNIDNGMTPMFADFATSGETYNKPNQEDVFGNRVQFLGEQIEAFADSMQMKSAVEREKLDFDKERFAYKQERDKLRDEEEEKRKKEQEFRGTMHTLGSAFSELGNNSLYGGSYGMLSNTGFDKWRGGF